MKSILLALIFISSCGNSPISEGYWEEETIDEQREEENNNFTADLQSVSSLEVVGGDAFLNQKGSTVSLKIDMREVPQDLVQGQVSITDSSCESFNVEMPTTGSHGTRNYSYTDTLSLASLLNAASDGDSIVGKNLVVFTLIRNPLSIPFPFACGQIVLEKDTSGGATVPPLDAGGS